MEVQRHPGYSVGSLPQPRPSTRRFAGGFTLLEAQVAILVFVVAVVGIIGQGRVCSHLISSVEDDDRVSGVAQPAGDRVAMTVTTAGSGASAPPCDVRLESIEEAAGSMDAEVVVTRRAP
jgi:hypothetical protein